MAQTNDQEAPVQEAPVQEAPVQKSATPVAYLVKRKCEYPYGTILDEGKIITTTDEMNPDVFERIG